MRLLIIVFIRVWHKWGADFSLSLKTDFILLKMNWCFFKKTLFELKMRTAKLEHSCSASWLLWSTLVSAYLWLHTQRANCLNTRPKQCVWERVCVIWFCFENEANMEGVCMCAEVMDRNYTYNHTHTFIASLSLEWNARCVRVWLGKPIHKTHKRSLQYICTVILMIFFCFVFFTLLVPASLPTLPPFVGEQFQCTEKKTGV